MRVFRTCGARVRLAALIVPVLIVSANGQAAPMAAQRQQPPTPPPPPREPATRDAGDAGAGPPRIPDTRPDAARARPASPRRRRRPRVSRPPACRRRSPRPAPRAPVPGQPSTVSQAPVSPPSDAPPVTEQRTSGPVVKLSLDDTVTRALEFNLDVQVQRINPRLQDLAVQGAQAVWTPNLTNDTSLNDTTDVPQDTLLTGGIDQHQYQDVQARPRVSRSRCPGTAPTTASAGRTIGSRPRRPTRRSTRRSLRTFRST